jgi:RNA polymerase sigma-70 factor (ECF subfamily)
LRIPHEGGAPAITPLSNSDGQKDTWLERRIFCEVRVRLQNVRLHEGILTPLAEDETAQRDFLAAVERLQPRLHRFCARMCGSALDGEDVVQDVIAQAFERLDTLEDATRLEPWLFRIAHHKCVDFLRRDRRWREDVVSYEEEHDLPQLVDEPAIDDARLSDAIAAVVADLPPKERAALLLKDVLDYPISDIAEVIASTTGGAKAALHRARAKLDERRNAPKSRVPNEPLDAERRPLLDAYVECFNRRDWDALRQLIRGDARLELVGMRSGTMMDIGRNYFGNYTALPWTWRLTVGLIDGEPVIIHWRQMDSGWRAVAAVRLWWEHGSVVRIRDYIHVDYLLDHTRVESDDSAEERSWPN